MTAVDFRDVSLAYRTSGGRRLALDGVDLSVGSGEFVALVGPSGCGKSTLLKVAAGLVVPTAGEVRVDGAAVTAPPAGVGMLFQNDALLPWRSAGENVRLPMQIADVPRAEQDRRVTALLGRVGLADFTDYTPNQLSGGMRKRVALARTLAADPKVFLMDEPFGPLDALTRREIGRDFLDLWEELRTTVLFVTTTSTKHSCWRTGSSSCHPHPAASSRTTPCPCPDHAIPANSDSPPSITTSTTRCPTHSG